MSNSFKKRLIIFFISFVLIPCFHVLISKKIEFVAYSGGNLKIQDYAYHIIITKAFWFDGFGDIYKPAFQQQALSDYIGSPIYTVMPLGITPIALVVWLPFAFVSCYSMALSYTLWMTLSLFILFTALWSIVRNFCPNKNLPILPIALLFVTVFSATTFRAIQLGQTSALAAGLILYLIYFVQQKADSYKFGDPLIILLITFILAMKPTYIALGLGLLIIYGMWREAVISVVTVFVLFIGITPILTIKWVPSYLNLLQMYSHGKFPEFYIWAIVPETMNIFRSAFRNYIGDNFAGLISTAVLYSVYIGVMGFSIITKLKGNSTDKLYLINLSKNQLFVLLFASYLLFAPYAGAYEDVLFIPVLSMVLLTGRTPNLTNYKSLILIFLLFVILLHSYFPPNKPLWLLWILKATLLGYMLYFCRLIPPKEKGVVSQRI